MFDDLLKKLRPHLEKLQSLIPLSKKSKGDEDDEDEEDEADEDTANFDEETDVRESGLDDLEGELIDDEDDEDDEDEEDDEDDEDDEDEKAAKEKKSKIIKIVIVLVGVYLLLEIVFDTDSERDSVPSVTQEEVSEEELRQRALEARRQAQERQERESEPQPQPEPELEPEPEPEVVETMPEVILDEPADHVDELNGVTGVDEMISDTSEAAIDDFDDFDDHDDFDDFSGFDDFQDVQVEDDFVDIEVQTEEAPLVLGETRTESETVGDTSAGIDLEDGRDSLLSKIEATEPKEREYVEPPNYDRLGRGLVYNCSGRHWACVDRESYFKCRDNKLWAQQEEEQKECYPVAVYATEEDCRIVQAYNVNTSESTDFCD